MTDEYSQSITCDPLTLKPGELVRAVKAVRRKVLGGWPAITAVSIERRTRGGVDATSRTSGYRLAHLQDVLALGHAGNPTVHVMYLRLLDPFRVWLSIHASTSVGDDKVYLSVHTSSLSKTSDAVEVLEHYFVKARGAPTTEVEVPVEIRAAHIAGWYGLLTGLVGALIGSGLTYWLTRH